MFSGMLSLPLKATYSILKNVWGASPSVILNSERGIHRADVLGCCARSRLLRSSTQQASMAISLQSFKVKNRVRRCGFPRKTQFEGSLPWINGALPCRLCESASPMRSSQNIFKLALPGPGTQGSGAEICRPHPDSYLSRNHENFGVHCCLYGYSRSRTTVCLAEVTRYALGIHC